MIHYFFYFFLILLFSFMLFSWFAKIKFKGLIDENELGYGSENKTVTGSGIIFILVLFPALIYYLNNESFSNLLPNRFYFFIIASVLISFLSLYDDFKSIDPLYRLIFQLSVVYFSLTLLKIDFLNLPFKLLIFLTILVWIYIINITNFIDGADGFLTINALAFFIGIVIFEFFIQGKLFSFHLSIVLIPILISFFCFNKPPAKLYMGDAGSVLLGYIIGFCFLELVFSGYWFLAISLYMYPLVDCSITLVNKVFKGYSPWARLFDYFFLIPIKKNQKNNRKVLLISLVCNMFNLSNVFFMLYFNNFLLFLISSIISFINIIIYKKFIN
jgi:UDP-N-acetylmuramyl pentapeptide phosphotransferase/UDP-N-acetylglucosamine-1-phosphate transferase